MAVVRLSAGLIPIHRDSRGWRYLLLRAYRYWDFPKGLVEPSEDPWEAALRELREETGIEHADAPWGRAFYETPAYSGKIARYYLGAVSSLEVRLPISPELWRPEHHEFRWLEFHEARGLLVPRVQKALDWSEERISQTR